MNWTTFIMTDYPKKLHIIPETDEDQPGDEDKENRHANNATANCNIPDSESKKGKYLPIHKVRKRLKKLLLQSGAVDTEDEKSSGEIIASVQADSIPISGDALKRADNIGTHDDFYAIAEEEMLLIRITTTRRTRNSAKDEDKLLTRYSIEQVLHIRRSILKFYEVGRVRTVIQIRTR